MLKKLKYLMNTSPLNVLLLEMNPNYPRLKNIIRSLNPNKSNGWFKLSARMLEICDVSIVTPIHNNLSKLLTTWNVS